MEDLVTKAIICGVIEKNQNSELFNYSFIELEALAEACNIKVVGKLTQNLIHIDNSTYIGSGKVGELKDIVELKDANLVIFNDELSPSNLSTLADLLEVEVIDRTMLILRIFNERAKTKEAKLQVDIATLKYMMPRLIGYHKNLSRTGGGGGGGGGARRGSGETALEMDRRYIENRIYKLEEELTNLTKSRYISRKARSKNEVKSVAVVGYTNSGKSTTINNLLAYTNNDTEEKKVFVKDMLFATLETQTRRIKLANNHEFLITDTVGFVSNLPHHLIEAFKSTLEEIREASLIIHVIDSSSPYQDLHIKTTNDVLNQLGCKDIKMLYVYNKTDLIKNKNLFNMDVTPSIMLDNTNLLGFDELLKTIEEMLFDDYNISLLIPYSEGQIYNQLKEKANIINTEYLNEGIKVNVILSKHLKELYKQYQIEKE